VRLHWNTRDEHSWWLRLATCALWARCAHRVRRAARLTHLSAVAKMNVLSYTPAAFSAATTAPIELSTSRTTSWKTSRAVDELTQRDALMSGTCVCEKAK
jgi:hypothetical protein